MKTVIIALAGLMLWGCDSPTNPASSQPATQPAPAYPEDDSWGKGDEPLKVPPEFLNGTATIEQAKAWCRALVVGSCFGDDKTIIEVEEQELVPGGQKALLVFAPSMQGTGGEPPSLVFARGPAGLRFIGEWSGGWRAVPPDSQGRPRLVSFWRWGGGEGSAYLIVLTADGFKGIATVRASGGDGACEDDKQTFEASFGEKPVSQETLAAIFGKAALQGASSTQPAAQPAGVESQTAWFQRLLKYPDLSGPLGARVKIRSEVATWEEIRAKVKPDIVFGDLRRDYLNYQPNDGRDMLWVEQAGDKITFRFDRAFTWKPDKDKPVRWVLLDFVDAPYYQAFQQFAWQSLPERIALSQSRPNEDHFPSYAILKSRDSRGGEVYEIGWQRMWSMTGGSYESRRILYLWHDSSGRWRFIGEGPDESGGHAGADGGWCGIESMVRWHGEPARPVISIVVKDGSTELGEDPTGLPTYEVCHDEVLDATKEPLPVRVVKMKRKYVVAEHGDTLEKIIQRVPVLHDGDWKYGQKNPDKELIQQRQEIVRQATKKLLRLNPMMAEGEKDEIPEGTQITIEQETTDVIAPATATAM